MQRLLITTGFLIALAGLLWPWLSRLPIGRLPGDILIDRPGLKIYIPLMSMLIASLVVSAIFWLFRR